MYSCVCVSVEREREIEKVSQKETEKLRLNSTALDREFY